MSRSVHWSERARSDLREAIRYIAVRNKTAASDFNRYVRETADKLGLMPICRPGELAGTFERVLPRYPSYLIMYTLEETGLYIVRFFHTAQLSKQ